MQQCSSEQTAKYKTSLLKYDSVLDLTGGFGVDTYFFANHANKAIHVERDVWLSDIVKHNFEVLGINNAQFYNGVAEDFLKNQCRIL